MHHFVKHINIQVKAFSAVHLEKNTCFLENGECVKPHHISSYPMMHTQYSEVILDNHITMVQHTFGERNGEMVGLM